MCESTKKKRLVDVDDGTPMGKRKYRYKEHVGVELVRIKTVSGKYIKVDACLAPLVKMLNEYGIETIYSCCGHGAKIKDGKLRESEIRIHSKHIHLNSYDNSDKIVTWLKFPYCIRWRRRKKIRDKLFKESRKRLSKTLKEINDKTLNL